MKSFPPISWAQRSAELKPIQNYDGQGKTQQQEDSDSSAMLGLGLIWLVICAGFLVVAIYLKLFVVD